MTEAVLADAQFSLARIYKPFRGFETVYQGLSVDTPIAIPGTLDPDAGKPGFDPNLLAGIPIPYGAKLSLWVPTIFNDAGEGQIEIQPYKYSIVWRIRNIRDFRDRRAAYHYPKQSLGESEQYVIPSAIQGILFEGMPRTTPAEGAFVTKRSAVHEFCYEQIVYNTTVTKAPRTQTNATGAFQQGLSLALVGSNTTVTFNQMQFDAMGDEFMVLVNRDILEGTDGAIWDFTQADRDAGFSRFYGTDAGTRTPIIDLGIYVFTGSNP